jgi:two-component sensor histidine kinase
LLLNELSHRVSNTLAVAQSMARQTLRTAGTGGDFVALFEGRLDALARAHNLLVEARWEGTEFSDLARSQLAPYISDDPQRLRFQGDPISLPPDLATPFGLVLHELATNAAKYGAFSIGTGRVLLSWTLEQENGNQFFKLTWQESGGPPVTMPDRTGFGGTLIERSLPGATVHREFAPDGVNCTISLNSRRIRKVEQKTIHEQPLRGLRILVADDEFLIAVTIEDTLRDAGAEILSAATLSAALKTANEEPLSAALLDVRLGRQTSEAVADALAAREVPFVFYSGQSLPDRMREKHPNARVLSKPTRQEAFVEAMLRLTGH